MEHSSECLLLLFYGTQFWVLVVVLWNTVLSTCCSCSMEHSFEYLFYGTQFWVLVVVLWNTVLSTCCSMEHNFEYLLLLFYGTQFWILLFVGFIIIIIIVVVVVVVVVLWGTDYVRTSYHYTKFFCRDSKFRTFAMFVTVDIQNSISCKMDS